MKLLHIDSSILGDNSVSRQVAAAAVEKIRKAAPGAVVTYRDLAATPLPHLTLAHLPGDHPLSALVPDAFALPDEKAGSQAVLNEFLAADTVVIGAPMYNFTIPSQLKAWLDRILVPGKTFSYGEKGPIGLAGGKRVIVAISRGGFYGAGTPAAAAEHAEAYLQAVFGFIGIVNPEFIVAEGVQAGSEQREKSLGTAVQAAAGLPL